MVKLTNIDVVKLIDDYAIKNQIFTCKTVAHEVAKTLGAKNSAVLNAYYAQGGNFCKKFTSVDYVHLLSFAKTRQHLTWELICQEYDRLHRKDRAPLKREFAALNLRKMGFKKKKAKRDNPVTELAEGFNLFLTSEPKVAATYRELYHSYQSFCMRRSIVQYRYTTFCRKVWETLGDDLISRTKRIARLAAIKDCYKGPKKMTKAEFLKSIHANLPQEFQFSTMKNFSEYLYSLKRRGEFSGEFKIVRSREFNAYVRRSNANG
jgi:hypothetical protein